MTSRPFTHDQRFNAQWQTDGEWARDEFRSARCKELTGDDDQTKVRFFVDSLIRFREHTFDATLPRSEGRKCRPREAKGECSETANDFERPALREGMEPAGRREGLKPCEAAPSRMKATSMMTADRLKFIRVTPD